MARTYKQPSIVSGLSINDILNMDIDVFNQLGASDMRKIVGRLVSAGNKRLRSFERAGERSPATRHVEKSGGVFSTRGKDLNALRAEYMRAKNFLQSKTGTWKGWKQVKLDTIKALNKKDVFMTLEKFDDVWDVYEDLRELDPKIVNKSYKYAVLKDIADMTKDTTATADEIALALHDELSNIYEERAELNNGNGVSQFIEIE